METIADLAACELGRLEDIVGDRAASLRRLAQGEDDRDVEAHLGAKSCGEENTFERDVTGRDAVTAALTAHSEAVARRLRREGLRGRTVTLKVKLGRRRGERASRTSAESEPIYPQLTRSKTLPAPTADGARIRDVAIALWDAAGIREPVRLLGVTLSGLEPASGPEGPLGAPGPGEQLELFGAGAAADREPAAPSRGERLGAALDAITERFGKGAIGRAVATPGKITQSDRRKRGE
jgi:DNA polymerase-4